MTATRFTPAAPVRTAALVLLAACVGFTVLGTAAAAPPPGEGAAPAAPKDEPAPKAPKENRKAAALEKAKLSLVEAIAAAEKKTGGKAFEAELSVEKDGSACFEVELLKDGAVVEVEVDTQTGAVEEEKDEEEKDEGAADDAEDRDDDEEDDEKAEGGEKGKGEAPASEK